MNPTEGNVQKQLCDAAFGNYFWDMTPKGQATKAKLGEKKMRLHQSKGRLFKFKMNLIVSWHTQCFLKLTEKDAMKKKNNKKSGNIVEAMY